MIGKANGQVGSEEGASGSSSGCAMKECRWVHRCDARGAGGQRLGQRKWMRRGRDKGEAERSLCVRWVLDGSSEKKMVVVVCWEEDGAWRRWVGWRMMGAEMEMGSEEGGQGERHLRMGMPLCA
ncbi:hypothetical protein MRB53_032795 [Persea americana]|uniref:Uncharacterized protein n=1 Tax=Persea americana TaxID=3435 RepID=A0ACC2KT79_PERAE|nr:hypothetical protein MRB53_032795 [Persea americana]